MNDIPKKPKKKVKNKIPPQKSAIDTSNWDNREFTTPSGRIVIETDQTDKKIIISE
jgi:hypothetical protein